LKIGLRARPCFQKLTISSPSRSLRAWAGITTLNNFLNGPSLAVAALTMGGQLNVGFAAGNLEPDFWQLLRDEFREQLDAMIKPDYRA
jgi:hypothetical protein